MLFRLNTVCNKCYKTQDIGLVM